MVPGKRFRCGFTLFIVFCCLAAFELAVFNAMGKFPSPTFTRTRTQIRTTLVPNVKTNVQKIESQKPSLPPIQYIIPPELVFKISNFSQCRGKTRHPFWKCLEPSLKCPPGLLKRVSRNGDGGKWMCGLQHFGTLTRLLGAVPCNVYSFGVKGDSSFENDILRATNCSVFAYDPTVSTIGYPNRSKNPRVRTLKTYMEQNGGHRWIDVLKIDVEASEFAAMENILETFDELPFGQLIIEFHEFLHIYPNSTDWVVSLLERLQDRGLRLFHTEPNPVASEVRNFRSSILSQLDILFLRNYLTNITCLIAFGKISSF